MTNVSDESPCEGPTQQAQLKIGQWGVSGLTFLGFLCYFGLIVLAIVKDWLVLVLLLASDVSEGRRTPLGSGVGNATVASGTVVSAVSDPEGVHRDRGTQSHRHQTDHECSRRASHFGLIVFLAQRRKSTSTGLGRLRLGTLGGSQCLVEGGPCVMADHPVGILLKIFFLKLPPSQQSDLFPPLKDTSIWPEAYHFLGIVASGRSTRLAN
jgi:hypothetical protein